MLGNCVSYCSSTNQFSQQFHNHNIIVALLCHITNRVGWVSCHTNIIWCALQNTNSIIHWFCTLAPGLCLYQLFTPLQHYPPSVLFCSNGFSDSELQTKHLNKHCARGSVYTCVTVCGIWLNCKSFLPNMND